MKQWKHIPYLEDKETLSEAITTAKYILSMYNETETTFYDDLHCDYNSKYTTAAEIRATARKHMQQLKRFINSNK